MCCALLYTAKAAIAATAIIAPPNSEAPTMFMPAGGALSDRFVERRVTLTVVVWFRVSWAELIKPDGMLVRVPLAENDCWLEAFCAVIETW